MDKADVWHLSGDGVVAFVDGSLLPRPLAPLHRLPGSALLVAKHQADSPVGTYAVLALAVPVRLGLRLGFSIVAGVTSTNEARKASAERWGFPSDLGDVSWSDGSVDASWANGHVRMKWRAGRQGVPVAFPVPAMQVRGPDVLRSPARLRATLVPARSTIEAEGPTWAPLTGDHHGFLMRHRRLTLGLGGPLTVRSVATNVATETSA